MNDEFTLTNDELRRKPLEFSNDPTRQRVLFAGLDCLPGQQDLFATDGEPDKVEPSQPKK
jgi:hypothetical protein